MRPIGNPKNLNRAILALQAIRRAISLLSLIRLQNENNARMTLYGALCTYYSRPFLQSKGYGSLSTKFIPVELQSLHDDIIDYRNTIIAHTDSDHQYKDVSVNCAYLVSEGCGLYVTEIYKTPSNEYLSKVDRLLKEVEAKLSASVTDCLNNGPPSKMTFSKGTYRLKLDGQDNWFEKVEDLNLNRNT